MAASSSSYSWPDFDVKVTRKAPELLPPSSPTPREVKLLSDIDDQETFRFQLPFIMFYPKSNDPNKRVDPVKTLKQGIAEALVPYYPLAGRVREGADRKLSVDCTGEGIIFIEAEADATLEELSEWMRPPCPWLEEFMYDVPGSSAIVGTPLLLVQVTRLACGGSVVAVRENHTVIDGIGLVYFLHKVAEITRGDARPVSKPPVWRRDILMARDPPLVTCVHHEYEDVPDNSYSHFVANDVDNMVRSSFFFGPKELAALRKQLPPSMVKSSAFEVITACMWRCRTAALELDPEELVRLSFSVNARGVRDFEVPEGFYGNAFAMPTAVSKAGQLCKSPLGYALEHVKIAKARMSKEYIQSAADLIVTRGRAGITKVWNFVVSDASKAGLDLMDFGWGKPACGGPAGPLPLLSPYGRYKNKKGEVGVVVPLLLPPMAMIRLRKELIKMTRGAVEGIAESKPSLIASNL